MVSLALLLGLQVLLLAQVEEQVDRLVATVHDETLATHRRGHALSDLRCLWHPALPERIKAEIRAVARDALTATSTELRVGALTLAERVMSRSEFLHLGIRLARHDSSPSLRSAAITRLGRKCGLAALPTLFFYLGDEQVAGSVDETLAKLCGRGGERALTPGDWTHYLHSDEGAKSLCAAVEELDRACGPARWRRTSPEELSVHCALLMLDDRLADSAWSELARFFSWAELVELPESRCDAERTIIRWLGSDLEKQHNRGWRLRAYQG